MTLKTLANVRMSEDILTEYATGTLSPAKHVLVTCQNELSDMVSERIAFQEAIAATLLEDVKSEGLSDFFMGNALAALPKQESDETVAGLDCADGLAPKSLRHMLGHGLKDITWKSMVPGVAVHDILGNRHTKKGDRLYLLKAKGGVQMPEHSHNGEEWTLILTGSYNIGDKTFRRGDLHIEDETTEHAPHINEGEDCICLVMTQGPLKMKGWLPKLIQPVIGI